VVQSVVQPAWYWLAATSRVVGLRMRHAGPAT